ncbi:TIGR03668 family PPOX class F420-dependent oxidoreductase [Fodinicola feengrottensis]|uniref:TIGR03668 family PPOX class F420-dependent oxidoreductase n=1 Tax=Fodinicola feengrottensis TaxID=435914 RepID=A0ABP4TWQ1_9ACTN
MRLTAAESRHRFTAARVARLATVDAGGRPLVVPVTFAVSPTDLIYVTVDHKPKSTRSLRRLANIAANDQVSFLVDVYEDDWTRLWWARADCRAVVRDEVAADVLALLQAKYEQYVEHPPAGPLIAAQVRTWSGWSYAPA